jgi:hypothetical protein
MTIKVTLLLEVAPEEATRTDMKTDTASSVRAEAISKVRPYLTALGRLVHEWLTGT